MESNDIGKSGACALIEAGTKNGISVGLGHNILIRPFEFIDLVNYDNADIMGDNVASSNGNGEL